MFYDAFEKYLADARTMENALNRHGRTYQTLAEAFGEDLKNITFIAPKTVVMSAIGDYESMLRCIRHLRRHGLSALTKPQIGKNEYLAYFMARDSIGNEVPDSPYVLLDFTSTVCRRVKTGTRLVEEDVYETICGEPPLLVDVQAAVEKLFPRDSAT